MVTTRRKTYSNYTKEHDKEAKYTNTKDIKT